MIEVGPLLETLTRLSEQWAQVIERLDLLLEALPRRTYFKRHVSSTSAAAAPEILTFDPEALERIYHIARVAVENETSIGAGDIRIVTNLRDAIHPCRQFAAPAPNVLYVDDEEILLRPGEVLQARFTGTVAGDSLHMYLEGWWEPATD